MGPLSGLRILDLATLIAGPLSSTLLADLGADVLKVELPNGCDSLRTLPPFKDGVPLWWKVTNRNKQGITLDVRTEEGRKIFLDLIADRDVLVENFRTGTLDKWGLTSAVLRSVNPKLIILRVTGFGQTGPDKTRPGFARMFEALSGYTYISGPADRPPSYNGYPIGDAVAGLFGALGILSALLHLRGDPDDQAQGQDIDLSATEAMFRLLEFLPIEYDQLGVVRERNGNSSAYAAPVNTYKTADDKWVSLHASAQPMWERLALLIGNPYLAGSAEFADNENRVRNWSKLNPLIEEWVRGMTYEALSAALNEADIAHCPIYSIADIFNDPQVAARNGIIQIDDASLGAVKMQGVVPRFEKTPGGVHATGPNLGQDNDNVYAGLGIDALKRAELHKNGVI